MKTLSRTALAAWLVFASCGVEQELFGPLLDDGNVVLPEPKDTVLRGQASAFAGGEVRFLQAGASPVPGAAVEVDAEGLFVRRFPGTESWTGLVVQPVSGDRAALGLLPELPRQPTVFHEERVVDLWNEHPSLADLGVESTAASLVVLAAARDGGVPISALEPAAIEAALDETWGELAVEGSPAHVFGRAVATLDEAAAKSGAGFPWLDPPSFAAGGSALDPSWLDQVVVDYDGDGFADGDAAAFDQLLEDAAAGLELGVCHPPDRIRVVFRADLREGARDGNCSAVDPFKWAADEPGKSVWLTGGLHEDTPRCTASRTDHCLDDAEIDLVHATLGSWVPNQVAMFDDGSHGDVEGGDGVWSVALDLPYIPTATSPDGAGVRIGYKYTFGLAGQGWTGSEEWPGNQRLLEIEDLDGDHVVLRSDVFGDEASNKDKKNSLAPARGGCGTVDWESARDPDCAGDTRENPIDTDGDCVPDSWPPPGPVAPLTVPCDGEAARGGERAP